MHGEDRILAIILDGEPYAKDSAKFDNVLECFPDIMLPKNKTSKTRFFISR
jgi:hypothetical protein